MTEAELQIDDANDGDFVRVLKDAGLIAELDDAALESVLQTIEEARADLRRIEILERYYAAEGNAKDSARRAKADRYFAHHDSDRVTAHQLVARLAMLNPELPPVHLQRIGTDDGPLVLRAGDHFSAVADEDDDQEALADTVAVRALIRAFNALLARAEIAVRLLPILPDEHRELYLAANRDGAAALLATGCLELRTKEALDEFTHW